MLPQKRTCPNSNQLISLGWIAIAAIGRLVPHLPNVTPLCTLCLFSPIFFSRKVTIYILLASLLISDYTLHLLTGFPFIGSWTIFTDTGWVLAAFASFTLFDKNASLSRYVGLTLFTSFGFWVFTNFGVWCFSNGMYHHNLNGFINCYFAALPFLRDSLFGNCLWTVGIGYCLLHQPALRKSCNNLL